MKLLRPSEIIHGVSKNDCPMLVLSDNLNSLTGWGIRKKTGGMTHCMWMPSPGIVATQEWRYRIRRIIYWLDGKHRLKFYRNVLWGSDTQGRLSKAILDGLLAKRTAYDLLGILGHAINIRGLNIPWLDYCGERTAKELRLVEPEFPWKHPTPNDIDSWCKRSPNWELYGVFDPTV